MTGTTEQNPQPPAVSHRSRRGRWLIGVVIFVAAVAAMTGFVLLSANRHRAQSPAAGTPTATAITIFTPFDRTARQPRVEITATSSGNCWTGSIAVNDPDAFRCLTVDNHILDPCFRSAETPAPSQLLCVPAPWAPGTALNLTAPLPSTEANSGPPDPTWAFQLANGARCTLSQGTADVVAGITMAYRCQPNGEAGGLNRSGALWTIEYLAPGRSTPTTVAVTTAWG